MIDPGTALLRAGYKYDGGRNLYYLESRDIQHRMTERMYVRPYGLMISMSDEMVDNTPEDPWGWLADQADKAADMVAVSELNRVKAKLTYLHRIYCLNDAGWGGCVCEGDLE